MTQQAGAADPADYDVVVIGGGPAGSTAATWLGRYRPSALVVDDQQYRTQSVEKVHGVLANDPVSPGGDHRRAHRGQQRVQPFTRL
jgi:thioredoxin reductase